MLEEQTPLMQTPDEQMLPHSPQLRGSDGRLVEHGVGVEVPPVPVGVVGVVGVPVPVPVPLPDTVAVEMTVTV